MKVKIEECPDLNETEVIIKCHHRDDEITKLVNLIESLKLTIIGKKNYDDYSENFVLDLQDIYYFESVENRTFAYTETDVYEVNYRLYEVANLLENTAFIQVSRTIVVNIDRIKKISTLVNGRILAVLENNEKMVITRVYAQEFKRKLTR